MTPPTPRVDRARVPEFADAAYYLTLSRKVRPVAHVLTILGFTADGPTYAFECRADARDLDKACAAWVLCECDSGTDPELPDEGAPCPQSPTNRHELRDGFLWRPAYGCRYSYGDPEVTDDAAKELVDEHRLRRGVHLVDVESDEINDEVTMTLLAEVRNLVGPLPAPSEPCSVRPTTAARYPGYGPEVELRELIEEALSDEGDEAVAWDDDHAVIVVDANQAAKKVLAWIEGRYDIPPDQRTLPLLAKTIADTVRPPPYTTSRIATVHPIEERL